MLSLNLLPPKRKESFFWRVLTKNAIFWGGRLLVILAFFGINFWMINLYLENQISDLDQEISSYENTDKVKEIRSLEKSAKNINSVLDGIKKISENQVYWDDAMDGIIEVIPPDVQIFSLEVSTDGKFVLTGVAKTRAQVLALGENLKTSPDFKDIQSPLDNLINRNDVEFKFMGIFLLDKFKAGKKIDLSSGGQKSDQT